VRNFGLNRQFNWAARHDAIELSPKQWDRLRAVSLWQRTGNRKLACQTFGMSQATLYRWRKRLDPHDLSSVKDLSRRPHRFRQAKWPPTLIRSLKALRERYPRWGKNKLVVLLRRGGFKVSAPTVGRMLRALREKGQLVEPKRKAISAKRGRLRRLYAVRKPKDYVARLPGDLVEVDTLDVRPLPGVVLKHFTARDTVSRWDVVEVHQRASASLAAQFLHTLQNRMPFPVRSLQVDGGSEFHADFEQECQRRGIRLFVLPPKSPKLNGAVERANRTHTEEFYEVEDCHWTVETLNQQLLAWEQIYNTVRPHQALNYLTPLQYLKEQGIVPKIYPYRSHMW
jgi:putative transposase